MAWETVAQSTSGSRKFITVVERTVDDISKDLVIGTDVLAASVYVVGMRILWTTTATVGDRDPAVSVIDGSDTIATVVCNITTNIQASQTNLGVTFIPTINPGVTPFIAGGEVFSGMGIFYAINGQTIRVFESATIDAADDMIVFLTLEVFG